MIKSFKIRLYPTKEQEQLFWKHIGSCRYIWNYMLEVQQKRFEAHEKHLSGFDMINLLKLLKNDGGHGWLYDISHASLQTICRDLDKAYKEAFKKTRGFPKFKSRKKAKASYPARDTIYFKSNCVVIEKLGKVKYKTDFDLPEGRGFKFTNPRISNINGKWMLSFGMECENQTPILTDISMGIDLGVKDLAVVEFDHKPIKFSNINKSKRMRTLTKQLKRCQRILSRKYEANHFKTTKNIERKLIELRRLYARISNIRSNYIHQTTHKLVSMKPKRVVMEDLNVQGMMKNRHLSKAIQEQCFYEFIRQMKYKCEWNGIEFVQANRFYPGSKTCSYCGAYKKDLKLSDRIFKCNACYVEIDRDYNAAINLSRYVIH